DPAAALARLPALLRELPDTGWNRSGAGRYLQVAVERQLAEHPTLALGPLAAAFDEELARPQGRPALRRWLLASLGHALDRSPADAAPPALIATLLRLFDAPVAPNDHDARWVHEAARDRLAACGVPTLLAVSSR